MHYLQFSQAARFQVTGIVHLTHVNWGRGLGETFFVALTIFYASIFMLPKKAEISGVFP